ncbi:hypothetical protein LARV_02530 [Longilinea arvoryzae]|uniref:Uncharacterized protein n=1 Tax=Longilinea arvoryzae TaxID=360412 RepID=A0A0S7BJH4_9CHLR|nr:hypothetical protein [Longilinea arvoryzae]GAP14755.1 hypothetical protein LARV_02530 [Longilinea arvoryzae]
MKPVRDMRKFASQTRTRLIAGGLGLVLIVGSTLIYIIYGPSAALLGLLCFLAGILPIGLVIGVLWLFEWISKRG